MLRAFLEAVAVLRNFEVRAKGGLALLVVGSVLFTVASMLKDIYKLACFLIGE